MQIGSKTPSIHSARVDVLEGGIFKITIPPTKQAIDEHFDMVLDIINQHEDPEGMKILLMFSLDDIGKIPTGYFVSRARKFWGKHKTDHIVMRVAYMVKKNIFVDLLQAFLKTLRFKSERNFYNMQQEDEAIKWLLSDRMIVKKDSETTA